MVQNLIFFAFWGIGKSEKCPIKSTGTITYSALSIECGSTLPIISKDLKHHLSVNCSAIISPAMSNG